MPRVGRNERELWKTPSVAITTICNIYFPSLFAFSSLSNLSSGSDSKNHLGSFYKKDMRFSFFNNA